MSIFTQLAEGALFATDSAVSISNSPYAAGGLEGCKPSKDASFSRRAGKRKILGRRSRPTPHLCV